MNKPDEVKKPVADTKTETYPFRRDFYYAVDKTIKENTFSFLLGPKQCGKTICLKQILHDYTRLGIKAKYLNFKSLDHEEQFEAFRAIDRSIEADEAVIYLLDDVAYLENAELALCVLASGTEELIVNNTRVLFAGNQAVTVETWANRAFNDDAGYIYADFLSYPEYLKYKKIEDVSEESYLDFLYNVADFHKMSSLERYLKRCLAVAEVSNSNTINYVYNSDCNKLRGESKIAILAAVCYQTLFSLRNQTNCDTFIERRSFRKDFPEYFDKVCKELNKNDYITRIRESFIASYGKIKRADWNTLLQAAVFLERCGLITITPIVNDLEHIPDVTDFFAPGCGHDVRDDLFERYNLTIRHPMFYLRILQDIFGEDMPGPGELPRDLLGSIVECQARGLLPEGFEVREEVSENKRIHTTGIDYVSLDNKTAVEFAVAPGHKTAFCLLPEADNYERILLTKDEYDTGSSIKKIPCYEYIYQLSGEEYAEKMKAMRQGKAGDADGEKESEPNLGKEIGDSSSR